MNAPDLAGWLDRLERRGGESRIEPGLARVGRVADRLPVDPGRRPVITVGGTNGKGSVVAMLEAMLLAGGYRPFAYTSPHLDAFPERMRVAGEPAGEEAIVAALETVERARDGIDLTYFEHVTLAALVLAADPAAAVDVLLLEVGLGGRLDAVNLLDADVAVITTIDIDHTAWLGSTRAGIAREKAGIARRDRPVVVGDRRCPMALARELARIGARVLQNGREFRRRRLSDGWRLAGGHGASRWPLPALAGDWQVDNAACAVVALDCLRQRLPLADSAVAAGLGRARLPGRCERIGRDPEFILDVAHNPAAARALAGVLGAPRGRSIAVFSALADKDVAGMAGPLDACFTHWLVTGLDDARGRPAGALAEILAGIPVAGGLETVESVPHAMRRARELAGEGDRVVVFGSLRTVARARPLIQGH